MSVLAVLDVLDYLDATRICARSSTRLADPEAWTVAAPPVRRPAVRSEPSADYSWWTLLRNPQALLLTGMVAADAVARVSEGTFPARVVRFWAGN